MQLLIKLSLFFTVFFVQFKETQIISIGILLFLVVYTTLLNFFLYQRLLIKGIIYLLLWIFLIVSTLRTEFISLNETKIEIMWLFLGILSFIIIVNNIKINRITSLKALMYAGLSGGLIQIFLQMSQRYIPFLTSLPYANMRWVAGFDGPNEMAAFYLMILSIVFGLKIEKKINAFTFILSLFIFLPLIYFSYSRGGLIGLGILGLLYIIYKLKYSKHKILMLTFYSIIISYFYFNYFEIFMYKFNDVRSNASDRDYLFRDSFELFKQNPIFGHGLGSFGALAQAYNVVPHSDYLLFMVSGGLVSLSVLLYFYFTFAKNAFKNKYYPELLAILTFIIQGLTFNNIVRGRLSILFWLVVIILYLSDPKIKKDLKNTI